VNILYGLIFIRCFRRDCSGTIFFTQSLHKLNVVSKYFLLVLLLEQHHTSLHVSQRSITLSSVIISKHFLQERKFFLISNKTASSGIGSSGINILSFIIIYIYIYMYIYVYVYIYCNMVTCKWSKMNYIVPIVCISSEHI